MRRHKITFALSMVITIFIGCAALKSGSSIPKRHEEEVTNMPDCLECHEEGDTVGNKPFSAYSHNALFFDRHGDIVGDFPAICESCHNVKFCSDCHAVKEEIVPSRKLGNRPDRGSPHRGDYMNKHKIEGRTKKAKCFKCHGRRNNKACVYCHNP